MINSIDVFEYDGDVLWVVDEVFFVGVALGLGTRIAIGNHVAVVSIGNALLALVSIIIVLFCILLTFAHGC